MIRNKISILMLFALFCSAGAFAQSASSIRINEVLVINEDNFVDNYGKRSGWVELYNSSVGTVDIKGCYLTDDKNNPTKYPIPKGDVLTAVKPRQHVLFWADGQPSKGTFHLNFTLNPNKENYIALFDADGKTLIDEVTIPAGQTADISYGRVIDGEEKLGILTRATPSTNNVTLDTNEKIENFKKNDSYGVGMTLTAMLAVFSVLLLLFIVFKNIGIAAIKASKRNVQKAAGDIAASTKTSAYTGEIITAISMALHEVNEDVHDTEDTVLTIKKVVRTYSPWSSKIYTLRETPKK
ncbi:MAG: lamin tail domain-containing protein [Tannerellaceae bacterium]|nr:lamin tail domain-containing protein [Tannerellaceae bacterium]MCD8264219.1 lamin tail domain-containing protein [Tannerellaceae bacterium]